MPHVDVTWEIPISFATKEFAWKNKNATDAKYVTWKKAGIYRRGPSEQTQTSIFIFQQLFLDDWKIFLSKSKPFETAYLYLETSFAPSFLRNWWQFVPSGEALMWAFVSKSGSTNAYEHDTHGKKQYQHVSFCNIQNIYWSWDCTKLCYNPSRPVGRSMEMRRVMMDLYEIKKKQWRREFSKIVVMHVRTTQSSHLSLNRSPHMRMSPVCAFSGNATSTIPRTRDTSKTCVLPSLYSSMVPKTSWKVCCALMLSFTMIRWYQIEIEVNGENTARSVIHSKHKHNKRT